MNQIKGVFGRPDQFVDVFSTEMLAIAFMLRVGDCIWLARNRSRPYCLPHTFIQMLLQSIKVTLLYTNPQFNDMLFGRRTKLCILSGHKVTVLDGVKGPGLDGTTQCQLGSKACDQENLGCEHGGEKKNEI